MVVVCVALEGPCLFLLQNRTDRFFFFKDFHLLLDEDRNLNLFSVGENIFFRSGTHS